jgi:hypothetical protein
MLPGKLSSPLMVSLSHGHIYCANIRGCARLDHNRPGGAGEGHRLGQRVAVFDIDSLAQRHNENGGRRQLAALERFDCGPKMWCAFDGLGRPRDRTRMSTKPRQLHQLNPHSNMVH